MRGVNGGLVPVASPEENPTSPGEGQSVSGRNHRVPPALVEHLTPSFFKVCCVKTEIKNPTESGALWFMPPTTLGKKKDADYRTAKSQSMESALLISRADDTLICVTTRV